MKNHLAGCFLILSTAGLALPLYAAQPVDVPWPEVCTKAAGQRMLLMTDQGETVDGYCVSVNVDEIDVRTTDNKRMKIARTALSRIQIHRARGGHELASLAKGMRTGFREGSNLLFSPWAPAGLVLLPSTVAWGAIAAPFCAIGDLKHKLAGDREYQEVRTH